MHHYDYDKEIPGARIKALRIAAGMSQADLAARAGITQSAVSQYESNQYRLYPDIAIRMAAALGTTPAYLMALDTVASPPEHA